MIKDQFAKPLALDLCCGLGGWAEGLIAAGWDVVGVDIEERFGATYPGRFVCQDVRTLDIGGMARFAFSLVVASPPCQEYSRHDQPWTKKWNPPPPDKSMWEACERIAAEAGAPLILENVRGAQKWHGRAEVARAGGVARRAVLPMGQRAGVDAEASSWDEEGILLVGQ